MASDDNLMSKLFELARSGPLLVPVDAPVAEFAAEYDESKARDRAWGQVYEDEALTWTDLRERERSRLRARLYSDAELRRRWEDLRKQLEELVPGIRRRLGGRFADLLDDLVADLEGCLLARLVIGGDDAFFGSLFSAYAAGGWPCGWEGDYPEGRLVVYWPGKQEDPKSTGAPRSPKNAGA